MEAKKYSDFKELFGKESRTDGGEGRRKGVKRVMKNGMSLSIKLIE